MCMIPQKNINFFKNFIKNFFVWKGIHFLANFVKKNFMVISKSFFNDRTFEMYFLREQFWCASMFWNVFFEGAVILVFSFLLYAFMVAD